MLLLQRALQHKLSVVLDVVMVVTAVAILAAQFVMFSQDLAAAQLLKEPTGFQELAANEFATVHVAVANLR